MNEIDSSDASTTAESASAPAAQDHEQTLDEFCLDLSRGDKRVELIAGFHSSERAAGRRKDTASRYAARFQSFATQPV